jgi:hypothetical protein
MRLLALFILCLSTGCSSVRTSDVDWNRLINCIALVENGTPWKPGGVLCWTKAAWEEETNLPYEYSIDYSISRVLAISRLSRQAVSNHRTTINEIASLWNRGPNGPRTSNYGQRVANLYLDTP